MIFMQKVLNDVEKEAAENNHRIKEAADIIRKDIGTESVDFNVSDDIEILKYGLSNGYIQAFINLPMVYFNGYKQQEIDHQKAFALFDHVVHTLNVSEIKLKETNRPVPDDYAEIRSHCHSMMCLILSGESFVDAPKRNERLKYHYNEIEIATYRQLLDVQIKMLGANVFHSIQ